ncbi:hypothetical protein [Tengunoibacter tsumagoiensis]|uniref:Uncharacterized protein n=1 Tax=Tengunoibacter tsumagoiensis TaxID=2014871 RepID=A0A402A1U3_9CHLR|nr:hypothetical protein [Tengunoibacter tsumagoiensis]GCE13025.1 hypothetical protein KTT_28840 [Tengunoibacter tsumagoiensis]
MPWCRFFIPKIASPDVKPGDPDLNANISYAKCVKGHVIRDANDWVLCENLPAPDATCWQEGGKTIFMLTPRNRQEGQDSPIENAKPVATPTRVGKA